MRSTQPRCALPPCALNLVVLRGGKVEEGEVEVGGAGKEGTISGVSDFLLFFIVNLVYIHAVLRGGTVSE